MKIDVAGRKIQHPSLSSKDTPAPLTATLAEPSAAKKLRANRASPWSRTAGTNVRRGRVSQFASQFVHFASTLLRGLPLLRAEDGTLLQLGGATRQHGLELQVQQVRLRLPVRVLQTLDQPVHCADPGAGRGRLRLLDDAREPVA